MRILVVEDEEHLAEAICTGLVAEGFNVDLAAAGDEALERARTTSYDVILLDILLPGLNGFKVCATLREEENWTPVIMLTAKDGELDEAEALDTGADDYISKPFSVVVLLAHIRALVRRGRRERPTVLRAGDLTLDPAEHRCRRGTTDVVLTVRESRPRIPDAVRVKAVSKRELLSHVWGEGFEGDPNIVEVYAGYLRKKIDQPFGRSALETVRGVGYRIDADGG